jgi:isopenicillin N synthase-like dioxygenase
VDYADIPLIDLSAAFTKDGRANSEVTQQLVDALHKVGFCYLVNHGYSPEQVRCSVAIFSPCEFFSRCTE